MLYLFSNNVSPWQAFQEGKQLWAASTRVVRLVSGPAGTLRSRAKWYLGWAVPCASYQYQGVPGGTRKYQGVPYVAKECQEVPSGAERLAQYQL